MGWKEIDERLIKRGELILDLSFLEHYKEELETLNTDNKYYKLFSEIKCP